MYSLKNKIIFTILGTSCLFLRLSLVCVRGCNLLVALNLDNKTFSEVNISDINAFGCKWSPDSKKMLIMRSNFNDRKRKNSLIVLNKNGETYRTVIDYTDKKIFPLVVNIHEDY